MNNRLFRPSSVKEGNVRLIVLYAYNMVKYGVIFYFVIWSHEIQKEKTRTTEVVPSYKNRINQIKSNLKLDILKAQPKDDYEG